MTDAVAEPGSMIPPTIAAFSPGDGQRLPAPHETRSLIGARVAIASVPRDLSDDAWHTDVRTVCCRKDPVANDTTIKIAPREAR